MENHEDLEEITDVRHGTSCFVLSEEVTYVYCAGDWVALGINPDQDVQIVSITVGDVEDA